MRATGGKGSNQYQTKPGGTADQSRSQASAALSAAVTGTEDSEPTAEEVAWMFAEGSARWRAAGITSYGEYLKWTEHGGSVEEAEGWFTFRSPEERMPFEEAVRWRRMTPGHTDPREDAHFAYSWRDAGFDPDRAIGWWELHYTPESAPRDPDADPDDYAQRWQDVSVNWGRDLWARGAPDPDGNLVVATPEVVGEWNRLIADHGSKEESEFRHWVQAAAEAHSRGVKPSLQAVVALEEDVGEEFDDGLWDDL